MQTHRRSSIAARAVATRARTLLAFAATAGAIAVLGAMPAAQASTGSSGSSGLSLPVSLQLPAGELEPILSQLPIGDLGLGDAELSKLVSQASEKLLGSPLSSEVESKISSLLTSLLAGNPQATLGEFTTSLDGLLSGVLGKSVGVSQILEALSPAQASKALEGLLSDEGIVKALGGLAGHLGDLGSGGSESFDGLISALLSSLPGGPGTLQPEILKALEEVGQSGLRPILEALKGSGSLSGEGLTQLEGLLGQLGSLSPSELQQKLTQLLGTLDPSELTGLLGTLFATLTPIQAQGIAEGLLGGVDTLSSTKTAGELAQTTGTSADKLSEEVGTAPASLPESVPAVSGSLAGDKGAVVSLIDGADGLAGGLGSKGGEPGSGGGSGGAGGAGGAGSGSGLTLAVNAPASTVSITMPGSTAGSTTTGGAKAGKLRILSHKVRGDTATIVLSVPAAGRVVLSGADMKGDARNLLRAQRLVLKVKLAKAGIASLTHKRARTLKVRVEAAFQPMQGERSSASALLTFRPQSA